MFQKLFGGKPSRPRQPGLFPEHAWTLSEMTNALANMTDNGSADDSGIVVALMQFASRTYSTRCTTPVGFFCFAPARVKVKHYDYDPIGTWG